MNEEQKKLLEQIHQMEKEMHILMNRMTDKQKKSLINDMDDRFFERSHQ